MEDRLRAHYAFLKEQPPAAGRRPRRATPRALALAAGLLVVVAGGAYLASQSGGGTPLRADVGAADGGADGDAFDGAPVDDGDGGTDDGPPTSVVEVGPSETSVPDPAEAESGPGVGASPGADPGPSGPRNADGSPVSPPPGTELPPPDAVLSQAYGIWEPGPHDTCSKEIHDRYWVYGPDGKVYPTYHPPIDPATGCTFGHEHGRDPAGSDLADIPFPFGYVNEQVIAAGGSPRPESHVGHKIEWYDDGGYYEDGSSVDDHDQICDVAYKVHLDSHSDAALANNEHEVFLHARCENGAELIYRALHRFGHRGEFALHCDQGRGPTVVVGPGDDGAGDRIDGREVAAAPCFEDRVLVPEGGRTDWFPLDERWTLYQSVDSPDFGRFFVQLQLFVDLPARYWDGEAIAYTVDLCYLTGDRRVRDDELCGPMLAANPDTRIAWDHPASPFDGTARSVFMGDIRLDNLAGRTDWHTDANGEIWSREPFPGSIRQHVGTTPINAAASYRPDPIRSFTIADDLGIHPPN